MSSDMEQPGQQAEDPGLPPGSAQVIFEFNPTKGVRVMAQGNFPSALLIEAMTTHITQLSLQRIEAIVVAQQQAAQKRVRMPDGSIPPPRSPWG